MSENIKELTGYPSIDRPWLINYPKEVLNNRKRNSQKKLNEILREVWPDETETILNYYSENILVKDFFERVEKIACSFKAIGIKKDVAVMASLESVPEYIELLLAAEIIGCSIKNYLGNVDEIIDLINSDKTIQFYFAPDYMKADEVEKIYKTTSIKRIILIDPLFSVTDIGNVRENILSVIKSKYKEKECGNSNSKTLSFESFLKIGDEFSDVIPIQGKHILFSAFTSGTSGKPKEVLHSSESALGIIEQMALFPSHKQRDSWLLTILPPTLTAVVIAMILYPLADGKKVILDPYCKMEDIDIEMMYYEPACWALIPIFFNVLLESSRIPDDYDMGYFKLFGFGAEPMNRGFVEKVQAFLDRHQCKAPFSSGYGQSEGGSDFTIAIGKDLLASGSAGIPLIDTIISIFRPNSFEELRYGQVGEICKSGPGIMEGYADFQETGKVKKLHPDGKVWLHTGDMGFITDQGLLFVLGRKNICVFPDKCVFAINIENKLSVIDGVKEVIVVSGRDREHVGFKKPYIFLVAEKEVSQKELLYRVEKFIEREFLEEEYPGEIFFIEKRPIYKYKTDRKFLQKKYNI